MEEFNKKHKYNGKIDKEVVGLCDAMNSLPGIYTSSSCCGHGSESFSIWFNVGDVKEGVFFLVRCVDNRYWKYGYLWKIELVVGDNFDGKNLPIVYRLHSGPIRGYDAYVQANDLVENMNHHLNIENFMNEFNLNINDFDI